MNAPFSWCVPRMMPSPSQGQPDTHRSRGQAGHYSCSPFIKKGTCTQHLSGTETTGAMLHLQIKPSCTFFWCTLPCCRTGQGPLHLLPKQHSFTASLPCVSADGQTYNDAIPQPSSAWVFCLPNLPWLPPHGVKPFLPQHCIFSTPSR